MRFTLPNLEPWAHVRAWLLSGVLLVQCVSSLPARPLSAHWLQRPEGQRALFYAQRALRLFGTRVALPVLAEHMRAESETLVDLRRRLLTPVAPLFDALGVQQQWSLFMVSAQVGFRLRIEARAARNDWGVVYRAGGVDGWRLAPRLGYRRLRGIYNPGAISGPRPQYRGFVQWLAADLLQTHTELACVRVGFERFELPTRDRPNRTIDVVHALDRCREWPR